MPLQTYPDATPRPGERALEVIQVGTFRGLILSGSGVTYDSGSYHLDFALAEDFQGLEGIESKAMNDL
ncbi:hypothetical protein HYX12_02520, partial [Candidatus Woesearchaeota archaeon]|nr:hypothetical protein [Candidatus Woesearchaeota archaeon]